MRGANSSFQSLRSIGLPPCLPLYLPPPPPVPPRSPLRRSPDAEGFGRSVLSPQRSTTPPARVPCGADLLIFKALDLIVCFFPFILFPVERLYFITLRLIKRGGNAQRCLAFLDCLKDHRGFCRQAACPDGRASSAMLPLHGFQPIPSALLLPARRRLGARPFG